VGRCPRCCTYIRSYTYVVNTCLSVWKRATPRALIVMARKQPPDLRDIANEFAEMSWGEVKKLALQLGVKKSSLNTIEEDRQKSDDRKLDAMEQWLKQDSNASWEKIVDALNSKALQRNNLADSIREKYCAGTCDNNLTSLAIQSV